MNLDDPFVGDSFLGMGDHFVLLMNRLTTDSALEAAIESEGRIPQVLMSPSKESTADISIGEMTTTILSTPRELVQCRICHDEDELLNMETPCSCCGSLKVRCSLICRLQRCPPFWMFKYTFERSGG